MKLRLLATVVCTLAMAVSARGATSYQELQKMFDRKEYVSLLKKMAPILATPRESARVYDLHALYCLRAETHIRLNDFTLAARSFGDAAKVAKGDQQQAVDKSTQLLMEKTVRQKYTPKTSPSKPIDVVNPTSRTAALKSLFRDQLAQQQKTIDAAKRGTTLPGVAEAIVVAQSLSQLELAVTGKQASVNRIVTELCSHAEGLMKEALMDMVARGTALQKLQRSKTRLASPTNDGTFYWEERGLTGNEQSELKGMITTCGRIHAAASDLTTKIGKQAGNISRIPRQAEQVAAELQRVLKYVPQELDHRDRRILPPTRVPGNVNQK